MTNNVLEVGTNDRGEVVVNHPDLQPDENGVGHIVFSRQQAMNFARVVLRKALDIPPTDDELRQIALDAGIDLTAASRDPEMETIDRLAGLITDWRGAADRLMIVTGDPEGPCGIRAGILRRCAAELEALVFYGWPRDARTGSQLGTCRADSSLNTLSEHKGLHAKIPFACVDWQAR